METIVTVFYRVVLRLRILLCPFFLLRYGVLVEKHRTLCNGAMQPKCNRNATMCNYVQPWCNSHATIMQPYATVCNRVSRLLRKFRRISRHDRYEYKTLTGLVSYPCQRGIPFETPASYGRREPALALSRVTATR
jgi:hypothetical protein